VTTSIYPDKLESHRLITRRLTEADILVWADFFADKEAVELFPTFELTTNLERSEYWVEKQLTRYENNYFGLQALINKNTNDFIGQCGLLTQEIDGEVEIEVGYHIFKKYWGQGFAPEAARMFIDYAFQNDLANTIISIIDKRNIKSQRVADKIGMIQGKETTWAGLDVYIYRIEKSKWNKAKNK
jgi:[ribosomal protein S5]-alanine N-acetyltransferase